MVYEQLKIFFNGFCCDVYLMVVMCGVIGVFLVFYYDFLDINNLKYCEVFVYCLIVKMLIIVVMVYKYFKGELMMYLCNDLNYVENFLYMMFNIFCEIKLISFVLVKVMDCIFIFYVDYEQNVFIFMVCLVGFFGVNLFVCIVFGIVVLWGLVYGGVNEVVLCMFDEIGDVFNIDKFVEKVKDKNDLFKLMGFGYCVYKNFDLCVKVMKQICDEVFQELGINDL